MGHEGNSSVRSGQGRATAQGARGKWSSFGFRGRETTFPNATYVGISQFCNTKDFFKNNPGRGAVEISLTPWHGARIAKPGTVWGSMKICFLATFVLSSSTNMRVVQ